MTALGTLRSIVDITVVVVSYHCREDLLACIDSLAAAGGSRRVEVVVVDNGSTDGTREAVLGRRWDGLVVRLVTFDYNAGFAKATNTGISRARGRHVLLLNPDTVVAPGSLDVLADWVEAHPGAGAVAPRLLNPDGTDQRTARSFPTPAAALFGRRSPLTRLFPRNRWSTRFLSGRDHAGDAPFRTDWASGAALMVPRRVIDQIGGLDEGFFLFWEDADYCKRLADAGYEVWCVPVARVTHDEGGTRQHRWRPATVVHFHRGAYRLWCKGHRSWPWLPARILAALVLAGRAGAVMALQALAAMRRPSPDNPEPAIRPASPIASSKVSEL